MTPTERRLKAIKALNMSEAIAAGYSLSEARAAGYSLSSAIAAGYSLSEARAAGYSLSEARAAGYKKSDFKKWDSIPVLENPYSKMLTEIKAGIRIFKQSDFGKKETCHLCGTPMCIGGHLVQMAVSAGYTFNGDYALEAYLIAKKSHPTFPTHDFMKTNDENAFALLEELAECEANGTEFTF